MALPLFSLSLCVRYALQELRAEGCLSPGLKRVARARHFDAALVCAIKPRFERLIVRRA